MPIHLTIKNENRPNPRTASLIAPVVVAGETTCFVIGNKGSAGVKNLVKKGLFLSFFFFFFFFFFRDSSVIFSAKIRKKNRCRI